jgi:hypothetical protein
VGVCVERSIELVVSIVAVHKAGGASGDVDDAEERTPRDRG